MPNFVIDGLVYDDMVNCIGRAVDANGGGTIEICAGAGRVLAELQMSKMSFKPAVNGSVSTNAIKEVKATASGRASQARVLDGSGNHIFTCDVGGLASSAAIKLTSVDLIEGGVVKIDSITVSMKK